ncbi:hypothetical protein IVA94_14845 [Bradyrhizobium sp. 156]|uniref:hypothetical protein n=1 Tax=Bradyrhizobium sp. 156 TaxID=2782630 RepID=UPI001FF99461|nr:hypothetical protein [Bradyrhizobium sp. 156]MCK1322146.1 hypothetical protein [Bradyrhizobium sp. 156]
MNNANVYPLAALAIGAARSLSILTPVADLDGMEAVTIEANFQYGSGGTTCSAIVATTFDGGTTWRHIARFDFTTATAVKVANLNGHLSKAVTAYVDLASEGVLDGVLGDQLAVLVQSTGTYVNSVLSVRASVR